MLPERASEGGSALSTAHPDEQVQKTSPLPITCGTLTHRWASHMYTSVQKSAASAQEIKVRLLGCSDFEPLHRWGLNLHPPLKSLVSGAPGPRFARCEVSPSHLGLSSFMVSGRSWEERCSSCPTSALSEGEDRVKKQRDFRRGKGTKGKRWRKKDKGRGESIARVRKLRPEGAERRTALVMLKQEAEVDTCHAWGSCIWCSRRYSDPLPREGQLPCVGHHSLLLTTVLVLSQSREIDQRPDKESRQGFTGASAVA